MLAPTYKAISEGIPALYRAAHCCPDPSSMPHLPSFGFGPTSHFNNLFYDNPFLYRVFSEKSISPLMDKGFVAGHYSTGAIPSDLAGIRISYMDVANRIGQWRIPDSKLISTTFSFSYAVFEAYRRHFGKRDNGEKDVRIAVICSSRVSAHSVTGLEMLIVSKPDSIGRRGTSNRRNQKLQRLTNAESEVLVKGQIPLDAVEACVTMTELLDLLPGFWINVLMSFFKNKRRPGSIFRRADLLLQAAFKACTISVCEDGEEMGVDLGIGILKLQYPHFRVDDVTHKTYEDFVIKATRLAIELAHFPCDASQVDEIAANMKFARVRALVNYRLSGLEYATTTGGDAEDEGTET